MSQLHIVPHRSHGRDDQLRSRGMLSLLLLSLLAMSTMTWPNAAMGDEAIPPQAFEGWQRLITAVENVEGRFVREQSAPFNLERVSAGKDELSFGHSGNGVILATNHLGIEVIYATNGEYAFRVERPKGDEKFKVRLFYDGFEGRVYERYLRYRLESFLWSGFAIEGQRLPDIFRDDDGWAWSLSMNEETRVVTLNVKAAESNRDAKFASAIIQCYPDQDWAIESFKCNIPRDGGIIEWRRNGPEWVPHRGAWQYIEGKVTYDQVDGTWVPKTFRRRDFGVMIFPIDDPEWERQDLYRMKTIAKQSGEEAALTLESYGLTKPK
ncbi:MAG: hypothetical protein WDZ51_16605 [Pirellulaceae bacterium]